MKTWVWQLAVVGVLVLGAQPGKAGIASLGDWCINANGDTAIACNGAGGGGVNGSGEANVDLSAFDTTLSPGTNNLGTVNITVTNANNAYYNIYADYDVDFPTEGSFLDQGSVNGSLPGGVSFSINDPSDYNGVTNPSGFTLFDQFANNNLDNTNHQPVGVNDPGNFDECCDVGLGLGISGVTGSGVISFTVSTTAPQSGFYLQQTNVAGGDTLYLSVSSTVSAPVGSGVPEPSTLGLGVLGLVSGIAVWKRRRAV